MIHLLYDAGPGVGLGHRRRMEALAAGLAASGRPAVMVDLEAPHRTQPFEGDVVVVDSYRHRADAPDVVAAARRLVAIDDLGRDINADLVVDPSPEASRGELRGLDYALVDPALSEIAARPVEAGVSTVLITSGGADRAGAGFRLARDIRASVDGSTTVRLVVGPWSDPDVPAGVEPVRTLGGLGSELADADLVITGGGVTMLETLALGRPTIAFRSGEGQERYLAGVAAAGAAVVSEPGEIVAEVMRLVGDHATRTNLARCARELIDGRGALRVADAVVALA